MAVKYDRLFHLMIDRKIAKLASVLILLQGSKEINIYLWRPLRDFAIH